MKLKQAILNTLSRDDLRGLLDYLEIDGVDRRSVAAMRKKLSRSRSVSAEDLLAFGDTLYTAVQLAAKASLDCLDRTVESLIEQAEERTATFRRGSTSEGAT